MALVTMKSILDRASAENYAVGAFNVNNLEFVSAIMSAAAEENSPVIIQVSEGAISYAGIEEIVAMVKAASGKTDVPVALHLDHGKKFEAIVNCIRNGFTSVMIDGSAFPLEQNIAVTAEIVKIAHAVGVTVEGEIGRLGGIEDNVSVDAKDALLTDPDEAKFFVDNTGVDCLAVAIGTSHGPRKFKGEAKLAIDLVAKIKEKVGIPLVLHGASGVPAYITELGQKYGAQWSGSKGVPDESIKQAVAKGINKVNIDTDMRLAYLATAREVMANKPEITDVRDVLKPARAAIKEIVVHKMKLLGSSGKAWK